MPIEDDLRVSAEKVAEVQIASGGGARSADAARLIGDYAVLRATYSPIPTNPAKLAEMRSEQERLLKQMIEFLGG